jgi:DeoR family transcriptional regulator, aga operon transcriptional repressor
LTAVGVAAVPVTVPLLVVPSPQLIVAVIALVGRPGADRVARTPLTLPPGARGFARICGTDQIDTLVTDSSAPTSELDRLRERGVRVIIA